MAEKLDPKEVVDFKELLMSNVYEQEALINLLENKDIIFLSCEADIKVPL